MGLELLFYLIPAIFLFGMAGFAIVAFRRPELASARWTALGFGFAILSAVVDSMRGVWPPDLVVFSVPLHWAAIAALMQAFLRRHPVRNDGAALFMLVLAGGIANVMVSRVHYWADVRIAMVNGIACLLVIHAVIRMRHQTQTTLDRSILGFIVLVGIIYAVRLIRYIGAGEGGDYGDISVWSHYKIVAFFSASILAMATALLLAIALGTDLVARLDKEKGTDGLTGIPNRYAHDARIIEDVQANGARFSAAMMLDIDQFKAINDTYGHDAGDIVLHDVALALDNALGRFGHVARIGGEEFAVLVGRDCQIPIPLLADRALNCVRAITLQPSLETLSITISIGHAVRDNGETITQALRRADHALYRAKLSGRDRALPADPVAPPAPRLRSAA